jgi:methyltransferase-like protein/SAM-dependent methyltransferase
MNDSKFAYDKVPYSSFTFPQTRPDRLATLGAFHGLNTASPDNCRVLELGCGDGTNLISFAYILPNSEFVGIDLSATHIGKAEKTAQELGLSNLTFLKEDVMDFSRERFGEFDFIIAHGLFSWVPDFVREKVLQIYAECLTEDGVGYISYNAYPGCHIRQMIWHMMQFHTEKIEDPMAKVNHGVNFLNFLVAASPTDSLYQTMIKTELSQFAERTAENIFHDDFASLNQPFYFHEFVEKLNVNGLQFLSEVDSFWMEAGQISPEILEKLDELGDDIVRREQYIDFIKCRPFRSTLVCRDTKKIERHPAPGILKNFYIASQVLPESPKPNLEDTSKVTFLGPEGGKLEIDHPLTKAALLCLEKAWSSCRTLDGLIDEAKLLCGGATDADVEKTTEDLLEMFHSGFVYLHRFRPRFASEPGEFPTASAFVRWQLHHKSDNLTTLSGMNLKPDSDLMRLMLMLLDGSRDRNALVSEVAARTEFDEAKKDELMAQLPLTIENKLMEFAKLGLLLG